MAETNSTGRVIATAGLAAGTIGTAVALLNGRRKVHDERYAVELEVDSHRRELEQLSSAIESRRKELTALLAAASERGRKSAGKAKTPEIDLEALQSIDWSSLSKRTRRGLERARREAAKRAPADAAALRERLATQGQSASRSAKSFGELLADEFQKVAPDLKAAVEAELVPRAQTATKRAASVGAAATDLRDKARDAVGDLAPEMHKQAETVVEAIRTRVDQAKPTIDVAAERLKSHVDHALPVVEDATVKAADAIRHGVSDVRPHAEELAAKAREAAKHAPDTFAEELKKAEAALGEFAGSAQTKSAEAIAIAEEKAKAGAVAAKDGTKEGTSFLVWTGAAASIVYFAFLNDEQREKVKAIATTILGEARDVLNDIQGHNGSFDA